MKSKLYNLVIIAAIISSSKAVEVKSEFNECLQNYLDSKIKQGESVLAKTSPGCSYITTVLEDLQKEPVDLTDTNRCVAREMARSVLPAYVTVHVANLKAGSHFTTQLQFKNIVRNWWIMASLKCVNNGEFNDVFDKVGVKYVAISTPEEKYCFAKYAKLAKFFQSNNFETNPSGITTVGIDCRAIIHEKREELSDLPAYIFASRIWWTVLDYIDMPMETKDAEKASFQNIFIEHILKNLSGEK